MSLLIAVSVIACLLASSNGLSDGVINVHDAASEVVLPVIDVSPLVRATSILGRDSHDRAAFCASIESVARAIDHAARTVGFFYITNHNVSMQLQENLVRTAKDFFAQSEDEKNKISMDKGGKAWRGFFPVGDEVTSGIPDQKEGIYFGTELLTTDDDERPLHGRNQWPADKAMGSLMQSHVLQYMQSMKRLGQQMMNAIACALEVEDNYFIDQFENPTELFRIFHYPPHDGHRFPSESMGVGEHTDYGYLTILRQDSSGGLQVRSLQDHNLWISAPPLENTFVINLGDALEHNTKGRYRATPHRVLQRVGASEGRISMPYFFDPSFDSLMQSMLPAKLADDSDVHTASKADSRWDKMDPKMFQGTYGQYLLKKVSKAFPDLFQQFVEVSPTGGEAERVE